MSFGDILNKTEELNQIRTETDKREKDGAELLLRKIVMPSFDKLSSNITVTAISRGNYDHGYRPFNYLEPQKEPFVVFEYDFKNKGYFDADDYKKKHLIGNLLGINRKGNFVSGKFIKYFEVINRSFSSLPKYQQYKTELQLTILSTEEFLRLMPLNDFYSSIMEKLGYEGKDIDEVMGQWIDKEKERAATIGKVLNGIRSAQN